MEYAKHIADKTRRPRPPDALFLRQKALITQCKNQVNNISLEPLPKQAAPSTAEPAPRTGRKSSSSIFDKDKLDALEKMNDNSILVQTIDEIVDQPNETQTPVKLTINDEGTRVSFELLRA